MEFLFIIISSVKRDLILFKRYGTQRIAVIINVILGISSYFIMGYSYVFNPEFAAKIGTKDVLTIFICGMMMIQFLPIALYSAASRINSDIYYGTLEAIFASPCNRWAYLIGSIISSTMISSISFLPAYLFLLLFGGYLNLWIVSLTLILTLLSIFALSSFGFFYAGIILRFRKSQAYGRIFTILFQYLCGILYPVQIFPMIFGNFGKLLLFVSLLLPYTYCYDLMRYGFIGSSYNTLFSPEIEFLILISLSFVYMLIGVIIFKWAQERTKNVGFSIL